MRLVIAEICAGILFLVLAVNFFIQALSIQSVMDTRDVGPGTFPLLITICLAILSALLLIRGIRGKVRGNDSKIELKRGLSVISFIFVLLIYVTLIPMIGYFITTILFFPVLLFIAGEKRLLVIGGVTVIFLVFAKLGFDLLLGVPLP